MLKISVIALCAISMTGCANIASKKDGLAEQLNPKRIHGAFNETDLAFAAEKIPVNDYYAAQKLAQKKYDLSPGQPPTEDAAAIKNYVYEGVGLVDAYCGRWFRGLDDLSRLLAYQNSNMNVITQLGTAFLGIGGASANFVTGYGAATTAAAGLSNNINTAFFATPTAMKVKGHIDSIMKTESKRLKDDANGNKLTFKEAYIGLEQYADLCTHARAKEIVESALDATKTQVTADQKIETVAKEDPAKKP
jgi:hypothetical protein